MLELIDATRAERDAKNAKIAELEGVKSALETKQADLERQLAEAGTANAALLAEKTRVDAELAKAKSDLAAETLARTALTTERDTLIQSLSVSDASLKEKTKLLDEALLANTDLRNKLEVAEKDLAAARVSIAELTTKIDTLTKLIAEKDATIAARDVTIAQNAADRLKLVQEMCKQKQDLERLGLDVQSLIKDKEKVLAEIKAKDEVINGKDAEFKNGRSRDSIQPNRQSSGRMSVAWSV